jgi:hypothetical protein
VSAVVLVGLGAGLVACHVIAPEWSRHMGLDVWNLSAAEQSYRSAVETDEHLGAAIEHEAARRAAARTVVVRLINGTAILAEAADELAEIAGPDPGRRLILELRYPSVADERHRFALHAIDRVKWHLGAAPETEPVLRRLEAEYRALPGPPVATRAE